jgi:hypothetical protein
MEPTFVVLVEDLVEVEVVALHVLALVRHHHKHLDHPGEEEEAEKRQTVSRGRQRET